MSTMRVQAKPVGQECSQTMGPCMHICSMHAFLTENWLAGLAERQPMKWLQVSLTTATSSELSQLVFETYAHIYAGMLESAVYCTSSIVIKDMTGSEKN